MAEQLYWHPILPDFARPFRRASRPDPPVVCPGFLIRQVIPGHALHEKGVQRQIGVGTLVNSQQRRALAVTVINHR